MREKVKRTDVSRIDIEGFAAYLAHCELFSHGWAVA